MEANDQIPARRVLKIACRNVMPGNCPKLSRSTRRTLRTGVALFSLALWLFMGAAEVWTPLHVWLHGGAIPDDDDCALVAIQHGKMEAALAPVTVVPVLTAVVELTDTFVPPFVAELPLPPSRAPPFSSSSPLV